MPLSKFKIRRVLVLNGVARPSGVLDHPLHAHHVRLRDRQEGYLKNGSQLYRGSWLHWDEEWVFTFCRSCKSRLPDGVKEVECLDQHWGWRAWLVLDPNRKWVPQKFRARRGKDRKTCVLCSAILNESRPDHYRAKPDIVACVVCYDRFVAPRSLAFIPGVVAPGEPEPGQGMTMARPAKEIRESHCLVDG